MQYNFEETLAYIFLFCNQHARLHNTHTEHGNVHVSKKMLIHEHTVAKETGICMTVLYKNIKYFNWKAPQQVFIVQIQQ